MHPTGHHSKLRLHKPKLPTTMALRLLRNSLMRHIHRRRPSRMRLSLLRRTTVLRPKRRPRRPHTSLRPQARMLQHPYLRDRPRWQRFQATSRLRSLLALVTGPRDTIKPLQPRFRLSSRPARLTASTKRPLPCILLPRSRQTHRTANLRLHRPSIRRMRLRRNINSLRRPNRHTLAGQSTLQARRRTIRRRRRESLGSPQRPVLPCHMSQRPCRRPPCPAHRWLRALIL